MTKRSVRALDALLPPITHSWNIGDRFRARSTALILCIGLVAITLNLFMLFLERAGGILLISGWAYFAMSVVSMVLLKLIPKPQVLGASYIGCIFAMTVLFSATEANSIFEDSPYWYPTIILAGFLVCRPRLAAFLAIGILSSCFLLMIHLQSFGFRHPFDLSFSQYVSRLDSTLILSNFSTLILIVAFLSLTAATSKSLRQEKDWLQRSARMRELGELAASVAQLIEQPLAQMRDLSQSLRNSHQNPSLDRKIVDSISVHLQKVTRVSESFALLSRPKQREEWQTIPAVIWLEHLEHICNLRAQTKGWSLILQCETKDLQISGPLGRLTMLVVLCLRQAFDRTATREPAELSLQLKRVNQLLSISIQFPLPREGFSNSSVENDVEETIRESLLQELLLSLDARMYQKQNQNHMYMHIAGQWI